MFAVRIFLSDVQKKHWLKNKKNRYFFLLGIKQFIYLQPLRNTAKKVQRDFGRSELIFKQVNTNGCQFDSSVSTRLFQIVYQYLYWFIKEDNKFIENIEIDSVNKEQNNHNFFLKLKFF